MNHPETTEDYQARVEYTEALGHIRNVVATVSGKKLVQYLFKTLDVGQFPEIGLTGEYLMDRIGFLRAGNSVYDMIFEANPELAASLLGQTRKEHNDKPQI